MKFSLEISKLTIIRACISYVKNTEAFLVLHQGFNSLSDNPAGLARTKEEILSRTDFHLLPRSFSRHLYNLQVLLGGPLVKSLHDVCLHFGAEPVGKMSLDWR